MTWNFARLISTARKIQVVANLNHRRKTIIVLRITNTIKPKIKTLVPLPDNLSITGSVDTEQVRNLALGDRWWKITGVVLDRDLTDYYMVGILIPN
ncbi:hypothetical protein [Pleurocapsa sp. PCC 7319]|uniref:hypothetical protein n=1 Tax=Pleurocapsa sp. PCC 7319 TaxID=118161 RepID=UPI0003775021|nr:hypothetical protein [Pleurocapsa sp. PCC 7319]